MPTPRKAAAAKKVAPTRRTSAPPQDPKGPKRWTWKVYGEDWTVKRPNVVISAELEDSETIGAIVNYLVAHIDESQRDDFYTAISGDEELDIERLSEMTAEVQELVYTDVPTGPSASS